MTKKTFIALGFLLSIAGFASAHSGATGIVKERMDVMGDIADSMKLVGQMLKGENDFDPAKIAIAAQTIEQHALALPEMFPEGSNQMPSEALPAIWENRSEFDRIMTEMETSAAALAAAAAQSSSPAEIKMQFATVGKTCSSCHQKFRLKK